MKLFILITVLVSWAGTATAFVYGPSNLSLGDYPEHSCYKPSKPFDNDPSSWDIFEGELEKYRSCIQNYIKGAEADRERIIEKAKEAVDEYNNFVRSPY